MKGPGKLLSMSYWMGMSTAMGIMLAVQSFVGKDIYIKAMQEHWVHDFNGQWVLWLAMALLATSAHVWLKSKINQKSAEIQAEEEDEK